MKKILFSLIIVMTFFASSHVALARTNLSNQSINIIVHVMRDFGIEEYKITQIVKILKQNNPPIVIPNATTQKSLPVTPAPCYTKCGVSASA